MIFPPCALCGLRSGGLDLYVSICSWGCGLPTVYLRMIENIALGSRTLFPGPSSFEGNNIERDQDFKLNYTGIDIGEIGYLE
jgi:hypothetical protein